MKKVLMLTISLVMYMITLMPIVNAQDSTGQEIEMADTFRTEGKIYVVVLVVAIVFTGLIIFAANTDRRLTKIEREVRSIKSSNDS